MTLALPSWNEGPVKQSIIEFVEAVTEEEGAQYVAPDDRLAVFDNDGTLWSERPAYFQLLFAIDKVKEMAPDHPEWANMQPFRAVLEGDLEMLVELGELALVEIIAATHTGMTTEEFAKQVLWWIRSARHPISGRPYTEMVFQPMLELIDYLRANEFDVFIVDLSRFHNDDLRNKGVDVNNFRDTCIGIFFLVLVSGGGICHQSIVALKKVYRADEITIQLLHRGVVHIVQCGDF